jgi:hypothetical protein
LINFSNSLHVVSRRHETIKNGDWAPALSDRQLATDNWQLTTGNRQPFSDEQKKRGGGTPFETARLPFSDTTGKRA